jgi:UDP-glucuronate 4-epimerase
LKPVIEDKNWNSDYPISDSSAAPYRIVNIGNKNPTNLMTNVENLEIALGKRAIKKMIDIKPGDVPATNADTRALE